MFFVDFRLLRGNKFSYIDQYTSDKNIDATLIIYGFNLSNRNWDRKITCERVNEGDFIFFHGMLVFSQLIRVLLK